MSEVLTDRDCEQCGHPFNPHSLIATTGDPRNGGIILCPVPGCECYSTWGCAVKGKDKKAPPPERIPDRFEIAHLREVIQSGNRKVLPRWKAWE